MATRTQRVKVGFFLLICLGLMAVVAIVLRGYYDDQGVSYAIEFEESISGLYEGAFVMYLGVPVGKVREIFVTDENKPHVNIVIDPAKVQLYDGVEAQLVIYSFAAGTMAISLEGGHPISGVLPPGSLIPAKPSILGSLSNDIGVVIDNMSSILESIDEGLLDFEPGTLTRVIDESYDLVKNVNAAVDDGRKLMARGGEFLEEAQADVKTAVDELVALSEELKPAIQDTRALLKSSTEQIDQLNMEEIQANLSRVLENVATLTEKLRDTVNGLDDTTATILHESSNLEHTVRTLSQDLQSTLNNATRLLEQLNRDPSSLVRGQGRVREN